jgi:sphinganine-1-phosphate aldolase
MILPITAHPAFIKAGALFNIKCVCVPVGPDSRVSLEAVQAAITQNTILLVASAPQYPHGVVDPISQLGEMALEYHIPLHVDACFGAFMLPFLAKLGYEVTRWDFRVRGVSSISADLHKYGYCFKGCGVILYRDEAVREYQFFSYLDWPGGVFGSPLLVGSRPGGSVAAAWMAMMVLGENGVCVCVCV